jgi:hypothetical protein
MSLQPGKFVLLLVSLIWLGLALSDFLKMIRHISDLIQLSSPIQQREHTGLKQLLMFYHFFDGQKPRMPHVDVGLFGSYFCYGIV